eukprot:8676238-Pyramimonas_sp.AAC.1
MAPSAARDPRSAAGQTGDGDRGVHGGTESARNNSFHLIGGGVSGPISGRWAANVWAKLPEVARERSELQSGRPCFLLSWAGLGTN